LSGIIVDSYKILPRGLNVKRKIRKPRERLRRPPECAKPSAASLV
jgi:hypothetical protein